MQDSAHLKTLNALHSFENMLATLSIIIIADDTSHCSKAQLDQLGLYRAMCVKSKLHRRYKRPTMDFVLELMSRFSNNAFDILFVNSDVVLINNDLVHARHYARSRGYNYVITGRRIDTDIDFSIDFGDAEQCLKLEEEAKKKGIKHGKYGLDYFLFSSRALNTISKDFAPFVVGVYRWDNALLAKLLLCNEIGVYDASDAVLILHQGTSIHAHLSDRASKYNQQVAIDFIGHAYMHGNTNNIRLKIPRIPGEGHHTG